MVLDNKQEKAQEWIAQAQLQHQLNHRLDPAKLLQRTQINHRIKPTEISVQLPQVEVPPLFQLPQI
jgi:hypothetical protein